MRAATANTAVVYVGPAGVTVASGYPLPAGEEVTIEIVDVSKVYVVANPAGNSQQTVTLAGTVAGDTFTLSLDGVATDLDCHRRSGGRREDCFGRRGCAGNVDVSGDPGGPIHG